MTNTLKKLGISCALVAALAPAAASAQDVFSCARQLVRVPNRQSCNGANAAWVASGGGRAVTISVSRFNGAALRVVQTQGYDLDRLAIGGCIAFRQGTGSDTVDRACVRTVGFHETTQQ
jgi:hypothetical protein